MADNAGLDSAELVAQLRAERHKEECTAGIVVISGYVRSLSLSHTYLRSLQLIAWFRFSFLLWWDP